MRMIIVDVLSDLGYRVMDAGDGHSGLRILTSAPTSTFCSPMSACPEA